MFRSWPKSKTFYSIDRVFVFDQDNHLFLWTFREVVQKSTQSSWVIKLWCVKYFFSGVFVAHKKGVNFSEGVFVCVCEGLA